MDHHAASDVPEELIREHQTEWHNFTRAIVMGCCAVTVFLLLGLVFIKAF